MDEPAPGEWNCGLKAELTPAALRDCDETMIAEALEWLIRQSFVIFGRTPRGMARETLDLRGLRRGLRRGPRGPARGTARVREEGEISGESDNWAPLMLWRPELSA